MTVQDIEAFKNCAMVLIVAVGFLSGIEVGRAFSFWKW